MTRDIIVTGGGRMDRMCAPGQELGLEMGGIAGMLVSKLQHQGLCRLFRIRSREMIKIHLP